MKTLIKPAVVLTFIAMFYNNLLHADVDPNWCGPMIMKTWKRHVGNEHHYGDKIVISQSGQSRTYQVKIKGTSGDKYSGDVFKITCHASPLEASISGTIVIDDCVHPLTLTVPYTDLDTDIRLYDSISFEYLDHTTPSCTDHSENQHGVDLRHPGTAHGHEDP